MNGPNLSNFLSTPMDQIRAVHSEALFSLMVFDPPRPNQNKSAQSSYRSFYLSIYQLNPHISFLILIMFFQCIVTFYFFYLINIIIFICFKTQVEQEVLILKNQSECEEKELPQCRDRFTGHSLNSESRCHVNM